MKGDYFRYLAEVAVGDGKQGESHSLLYTLLRADNNMEFFSE